MSINCPNIFHLFAILNFPAVDCFIVNRREDFILFSRIRGLET